jgi:hypothetical protein
MCRGNGNRIHSFPVVVRWVVRGNLGVLLPFYLFYLPPLTNH